MGDAGGLELAIEVVSWLFLLGGSAFCLIGGIGLVRMPDFYTRGHAAGVSDTLGAGLILVGLMFQAGLSLITAKLVFVFFFLWVTSPTATHALYKAAYANGMRWEDQRDRHHPMLRSAGEGGDRGSD